VLRRVSGNRGRAAEILGLSRKGLWGKLKAHGISDEDIDIDPDAIEPLDVARNS
jgi:DNA-binding NtrC family response regulator